MIQVEISYRKHGAFGFYSCVGALPHDITLFEVDCMIGGPAITATGRRLSNTTVVGIVPMLQPVATEK